MIKAALARGREPPAHLLEKPEPLEAGLPYWRAFFELNAHRQRAVGMTVLDQPLAYSDCSAYARDNGYRGEERAVLLRMLRALDVAWVRHAMAQAAKAAQAARKQGDRGRGR